MKVEGRAYALLATGVACAPATRTALLLVRLRPRPATPGSKTGRLPGGPKGFLCLGTLGPGNVQIGGGCTGPHAEIQWTRAG
jgi:hypothetical protein